MNHSTWRTTTATSHVIVTSIFLSRSIFILRSRQAWGPKRERLVMYLYRALAGAIASVWPHRLETGHARHEILATILLSSIRSTGGLGFASHDF